MDYTRIRINLERNGIWKALFRILYKAINKFVYLRIFQCLVLVKENANRNFMKDADNYWMGILDKDQMLSFVERENDLDEIFIKIALEKGDKCYGIIKGDELANYGWYSNKSTEVEFDLMLNFHPKYIHV